MHILQQEGSKCVKENPPDLHSSQGRLQGGGGFGSSLLSLELREGKNCTPEYVSFSMLYRKTLKI